MREMEGGLLVVVFSKLKGKRGATMHLFNGPDASCPGCSYPKRCLNWQSKRGLAGITKPLQST